MGKFSGKCHPQRSAKMQLGPGLWWTTDSTLNGCTQPQLKSELSRMLCFCPPIHCFILGVGGRGRSRLNISGRCLRSLLPRSLWNHWTWPLSWENISQYQAIALGVKDIPFFFHFLQRTLQILCTMPQRQIATCHESVGVKSNRAGIYKHFLG